MKQILRFVLIVAVTSSLSYPAYSATQAKAGAKCVKVNSTQTIGTKKFTCVKLGSRLIWNKGVSLSRPSVSTPAASPTTSASPEIVIQAEPNPFDLAPFPDEFTRLELVAAVFKRFEEYKKVNSSKKTFKLVIDPEFQNDTVAITKLVNDSYAVLPFPKDYPTTLVVITNNLQLVEKSVNDLGSFDRTGSRPSDWKFCLGCAGLGWASSSRGLSPMTPHEIFHVWQKAAYKSVSDNNANESDPFNPPIWFQEGGAEFFGQLLHWNNPKAYYPSALNWKPYKLKDYTTRNLDPALPYTLGRVASEYIIASKGFDKFLEIHWKVGDGLDFPTAFNTTLGISLENFYEKFDGNLKKLL
jgi:hypothetical protein